MCYTYGLSDVIVIVMLAYWGINFGLYCKMPKDVTYGRWEPEGMKRTYAAVWNGDIGSNAGRREYSSASFPEKIHNWEG
jgi:hypothetical protein